MNLGWYELMDRLAMIQDQLEMSVAKHQNIDKEFYDLIQEAQENYQMLINMLVRSLTIVARNINNV